MFAHLLVSASRLFESGHTVVLNEDVRVHCKERSIMHARDDSVAVQLCVKKRGCPRQGGVRHDLVSHNAGCKTAERGSKRRVLALFGWS